ncbi:MAG: DUF5674 family protein [Anaerolineae bacterium]|jgi:hypothetical protein
MAVHIIRERATPEQIAEMAEAFGGALIKLAVDVERGILAGGGGLHADCEQALLEDGSCQENIWGADWLPMTGEVRLEAMINIRPRQGNYGMEIQSPEIRQRVRQIVRRLLEGK